MRVITYKVITLIFYEEFTVCFALFAWPKNISANSSPET
jgi:hypothetical protein